MQSDARGTWISKMLLVNSHVTSCAEFWGRNHDARPNQRDIWKPWMSNKSRHIQLDSLGNDTKKTHIRLRGADPTVVQEWKVKWAWGWVGKHIKTPVVKTTWFSNRTNLPYHGAHSSCHRVGWRKPKSDFFGGWFVHSNQNGRPQTGGVFTKEFLHTPGFSGLQKTPQTGWIWLRLWLKDHPKERLQTLNWTSELVLRSTVVSYIYHNDVVYIMYHPSSSNWYHQHFIYYSIQYVYIL